ncbi:hypothetical protein SFR_5714 [Streptomyces sp. FR-008]|nr:hypothetical protein SFR_5714 [Streptomyces sp. FR-008]
MGDRGQTRRGVLDLPDLGGVLDGVTGGRLGCHAALPFERGAGPAGAGPGAFCAGPSTILSCRSGGRQ